jgi:hypothetical protein
VEDATPLWLSHHWPHQYDRCVRIGDRMVCRRCLVLYPVAFVAVVLLQLVVDWPARADPWLLPLLPLPAAAEIVGEQAGWLRPSPRRLVAVTVPLAVGCARLWLRYIHHPSDGLVLGVVGGYGVVCVGAVLLASRRRQAAEPLGEVGRVAEHPGPVAGQAAGAEQGQQGEGEAERPAGQPEPRDR